MSSRAWAAGLTSVSLLLACGSSSEPSASGTKTEWYLSCESTDECPDSSQCLCGICTAECSSDDDCVGGACSRSEHPQQCDDDATVGRICLPIDQLPFSAPVASAGLSVPGAMGIDDPSFTSDRLELYFAVDGLSEGPQIWRAERSAVTDPWGAPAVVPQLIPEMGWASMTGVTSDGLTLYYAYHRVGGRRDLYFATRDARNDEWSAPEPVPFVEYYGAGESPSGTSDGQLLVWARDDAEYSKIHLAQRASMSDPWEWLGPIEELSNPDVEAFEPWISDDGLTLYYRGNEDIYTTNRSSRDEPFAPPTRVDELSSDSGEQDPWLSTDGRSIMFASDREGSWMLYEAER